MPKPPMKPRQDLGVAAGVGSVDPEVRAQLENRERRQAQARKAKRPKATYDLPQKLIDAIDEIARGEQCARSDVVAWALAQFVTMYQASEVDLREHMKQSRSLRFAWKLELPKEWR